MAFTAVAIVIYLRSDLPNGGFDVCGSSYLTWVPYISHHYLDLCENSHNIVGISIYYISNLAIVAGLAIVVLWQRGPVEIDGKHAFVLLGGLYLSTVVSWVVGVEGRSLYNFAFHDRIGAMFFTAPLTISSLQFVVFVILLSERRK
jgi:hypothetical protein